MHVTREMGPLYNTTGIGRSVYVEQRWLSLREWGWAAVREASASDRDWILERVIGLVRWVTIVALFFLSLAQPLIGRLGEPTWLLILGFAAYAAIIRVSQRRLA